jgi:large subunit ribosomal protein L24
MGAKKVRKVPPKIRKDDKVTILTGKEKGKIGSVLRVDADKNRVIVEKVNVVKRHTRAGGKSAQGGIVEKEAPIHISNLMLVCNKCTEPTRIGKRVLEDKSKVRICKKCGELLDE